MHSIRTIGLISILAGAVLSQAQQLTTVTATPADVKPTVTQLPISGDGVTDLHLRPLFTTTIRLPEPVTSVAVGAPTLFEVEHSDQEPRLVFVKPSTKETATSNLVIALQSGQAISMRLLSDGGGEMRQSILSSITGRSKAFSSDQRIRWCIAPRRRGRRSQRPFRSLIKRLRRRQRSQLLIGSAASRKMKEIRMVRRRGNPWWQLLAMCAKRETRCWSRTQC